MAEAPVLDVVEAVDISDADAEHLIGRYIRPDSRNLGRHEAWVEAEGGWAQVWILIPVIRAYGLAEGARTYGLPEEAALAAIAYYRRNREFIDAKILLNTEEWSS